MKEIKHSVCMLILTIILVGCNKKVNNETNINDLMTFDLHNKEELKKYSALNLDESHPNLLDPEISLGNFESVKQSWINLHKNIDNYLTANNFDWEIEHSNISIFHKIYFHPDGKIKYYFFNIRNTEVTPIKRIEYAKLISDFAKENRIEFSSSNQFAQCGKTRYVN